MPQITIDGKLLNVENGKTVIEAAYQNGIEIPHFCWHPELSVSGNCRMCLVEVGLPKKMPDGSFEHDTNGLPLIQWFPKLQIACATQISDGMYIRTKEEKVISAQESVMEFLLINHPLDCPICDEAGECKLQDYAFNHSNGESRFIEIKNHKSKRQVWGPNVVYDAERCISCSRCIRYAQEIAQQDVLTFVNRGDHVTIELFEGTEFDNSYSMNVIELCPVGALTSKDFRFEARVWEMSFNESICTGCSRGCNIEIGVKNNQALRYQPHNNPFVNKYWLCDYGRLSQYPKINNNRINSSLIRSQNQLVETTFEIAASNAIEKIRKYKNSEIMIIGSPFSTNEDLYVLNKFVKQVIKNNHLEFFVRNNEDFADNHLKLADMTPNSTGAKALGLTSLHFNSDIDKIIDLINRKIIKSLILVNDDLEENSELLEAARGLETLISISSNFNKFTEISDIVIAASSFAEVEGTFVNFEGRVQHISPAIVNKENIARMGMKMSRLDKFGAHNDNWTQKEIRDSKPVWKIIKNLANLMGAGYTYKNAEEVFNEISNQINPFNGMNYELLDKHQGLKLYLAKNPESNKMFYKSHSFKP